MRKISIILIILLATNGFSQALNSFKYLIIPSKFEFQKTENQYGLSSLMEAYFKQEGFTVIQDKDITKELNNNRCTAVYANIMIENSMFSTKIKVVLNDCEGKKLLVSSEGISRSKEYDVAHKEALRMALKSLPPQHYLYQGNNQKSDNMQTVAVTALPPIDNSTKAANIKSDNLLVVETLSNGFLLVDAASSKVVLKLYNTSVQNVFIGVSPTKNGIVTRQKDKIVFEYIINNALVTEDLNIKF